MALNSLEWLRGAAARKAIVAAALFVALFRFNLIRLWDRANPFTGDPNWGHAVFVPLIGLLYLLLHRGELGEKKLVGSWIGVVVALGSIGLFLIATWPGQNDYFQDISMLLTLFGVVLAAGGWELLKVAAFPLVFLLCAIPWPESFYTLVAAPLQHLAAHAAVVTLSVTGVDAEQVGTKIIVYGSTHLPRVLNVAEACAGLRSLVTFVTMGGAVAFLVQRPLWQKIVISASTVPIAVLCNVTRVAGQGLLDHYVSEKLSEGFYHEFVGIFMFIPGFILILLVAKFTSRIFIEEKENAPPSPPPTKVARPPESVKRWHPAFITMLLILGISAFSLGAANRIMHLAFSKLPVALAKPLDTLPDRLGAWQQTGAGHLLKPGVEETLGTRLYVMRDYVDTRLIDPVMLARLTSSAEEDRKAAWDTLRITNPRAVINAAVTYYTGDADQMWHIPEVCHIPEICYKADGFEQTDNATVTWPAAGRNIEAKFLQFQDQSASGRAGQEGRGMCNVAYFFQVNGKYMSASWAVRKELHSLFEKHNYFAKIELMTVSVDRAESARIMQDFLVSALPEIEKCLPDWEKVRQSEGN